MSLAEKFPLATARPWNHGTRLDGKADLRTDDDAMVATIHQGGEEAKQTAALIHHAVNTYDAIESERDSLRLALSKAQERMLELDGEVERRDAALLELGTLAAKIAKAFENARSDCGGFGTCEADWRETEAAIAKLREKRA